MNYPILEDLEPTTRKTRTITLLESFFAHSPQPIICLQEISPDWKGTERNRKIREDNLTFMQKIMLYVKDMTALIPEYIRVIDETIHKAKMKKNYSIRITLKLKKEEKEFIVYTYHMPCEFKTPIIQFLHLSVFKRLILSHHMIPTIFAVDFNITPSSDEYKFFHRNRRARIKNTIFAKRRPRGYFLSIFQNDHRHFTKCAIYLPQ